MRIKKNTPKQRSLGKISGLPNITRISNFK
nr:MAG TPA: hypothetical protein [Caudoviricetes sp.]